MTNTIDVLLTDELRKFIDDNTGDGTLYATPSEFIGEMIRNKKAQHEAALLRDAVLSGYQDIIEGRYVKYKGNIHDVLNEAKNI